MPLEPCPECGHTISTLALACPACGAPGEATRARRAAVEPILHAPGAAPPRRPRGWSAVRLSFAGWSGTTRALLVVGALGLALLGAAADAAVHHLVSWARQPRVAQTAAAPHPAPVALQRKSLEAVVDTLRAYESGAGAPPADSALRLVLAEVAAREETWATQNGAYATSLDLLQVLPPPGVHVELTAGPGWWSANAVHDSLPGVTCTGGFGAGRRAGAVACEGPDTARAAATH